MKNTVQLALQCVNEINGLTSDTPRQHLLGVEIVDDLVLIVIGEYPLFDSWEDEGEAESIEAMRLLIVQRLEEFAHELAITAKMAKKILGPRSSKTRNK